MKKQIPPRKAKALKNKRERNSDQSLPRSFKKQILVPLGIFLFLALGTTLAILYARGYRFVLRGSSPVVSKTGILHATSTPKGAQIYINDHATTATDTSINLAPSKYSIKIAKDGYNDWQKDVDIHEEEVTNAEAVLFPKAPTLQSISTFGVEQALVDPTGTKIAFKIASQSAAKRRGIYIFDMTTRPLPILQGQSSSTQLADDTVDRFSEAHLTFSPDGKQLLASISAQIEPTTTIDPETGESLSVDSGIATYYLLKTNDFNDDPQDVTATSQNVLELWQSQRVEKENARVKSLKSQVAKFSKKYFNVLAWSPDEKKILYQASDSAKMPVFLKPRRIGNNLRYERRDLEKNAIYVYDLTEDINTRVIAPSDSICREFDINCTVTFTWFPDSEHLIYVVDKKINIVERDGSNLTTLFAGPFLGHYVFPWPDGSKIVILTNLGNPTVSPTLYTIGLK